MNQKVKYIVKMQSLTENSHLNTLDMDALVSSAIIKLTLNE